jgi:acyl-CoA oxidase
MGIVANHALVQAQLVIAGKRYGIHHFIVPIRDMETNRLLTGVKAGDIGPKIGYNTKDNGFMRLSNVSIPRENMLMRYT